MIFVITAFLRGFVKEIFSLLNWIISLLVCYLVTPLLMYFFSASSINALVLNFILQSVIFIATFIIVAFSTSSLVKSLRSITPVAVDKSLGVFYGIIKTVIIFGFFYAAMTNLYSKFTDSNQVFSDKDAPEWLLNAKTYNIIRYSGEFLNPLVANFVGSSVNEIKNIGSDSLKSLDLKNLDLDSLNKYKDLDIKIEDISKDILNDNNIKDSQEFLINETIDEKDSVDIDIESKIDKDSGYDKRDIEKMNRLIDIIN